MDQKRLERIEVKLDDVSDHLGSIDVTLKAQHITLKEHIRRTEVLEKEIGPIRKHVHTVQAIVLFLMSSAAVIGIVKLFYEIFKSSI